MASVRKRSDYYYIRFRDDDGKQVEARQAVTRPLPGRWHGPSRTGSPGFAWEPWTHVRPIV